MTIICSKKFEELSKIRFEPIPTKPLKNVAQVVNTGAVTVVLATDGVVYTNAVPRNVCFSEYHPSNRIDTLVTCLSKMGVLSKALVDDFVKRRNEYFDKQARINAAEDVLSKASLAGIVLSPKQKEKLEAVVKFIEGEDK